MNLRIIYLIILITCSGCSIFNEPDFDKPLIPMPEERQIKPKEEKIWVEAKTSKIWVSPHIDENGDMVDGHFKHIVAEAGHWMVKADERKQ